MILIYQLIDGISSSIKLSIWLSKNKSFIMLITSAIAWSNSSSLNSIRACESLQWELLKSSFSLASLESWRKKIRIICFQEQNENTEVITTKVGWFLPPNSLPNLTTLTNFNLQKCTLSLQWARLYYMRLCCFKSYGSTNYPWVAQ